MATINQVAVNGYFAEYINDEVKPIVKMGYANGTLNTIRNVIIPNPTLTFVLNSSFSSFLMTMYNAGLHIAGKVDEKNRENNLILTAVMQKAGVESDFANVKVLDVMALMGAVNYDVTPHIPDGQGGETPRPSVASVVAQYPGNDSLFIQTIKYLGLSGWIKYVYGERGMSFERFCELWFFFYPTLEERRAQYGAVNLYLRSKGIIFDQDHIDVLLSAELHTVE